MLLAELYCSVCPMGQKRVWELGRHPVPNPVNREGQLSYVNVPMYTPKQGYCFTDGAWVDVLGEPWLQRLQIARLCMSYRLGC